DAEIVRKLGIGGTPTSIVDGKLVSGFQQAELEAFLDGGKASANAAKSRPPRASADSDHPSMPAGSVPGGSTSMEHKHMIKKIGNQAVAIANVGVPLALSAMVSGGAHAFTAPAAGDLGYDIYDIVVNKGVKGPSGFVAGVAAFLFGVSRSFSNVMIGIPTLVAAVCLIKADTILQTFGMVV
ncbi:hypothetical protein OY671_008631, partial [Metschnikowia pulcherrima]